MTTTNPHPDALAVCGRSLRWTALAAGALGLIGQWPTAALAGGGAAAMWMGILIGLAGAVPGTVIPAVLRHRPPGDVAAGLLAGLAARFGVTLGLAVIVWAGGAFAVRPLWLWVGISHVVLLAVDTAVMVRNPPQPTKETA